MYPAISVVIPVKNEGKKIKECIEGLLRQEVPVSEIIVIDSGSTDDTLSILERFKQVEVIRIESSSFNHGLTRNLGVEKSNGEYIFFTVGDAVTVDNQVTKHLLSGFSDDSVIAVCGQQIVPHTQQCNPAKWFFPQSGPSQKKECMEYGVFDQLSPNEKKKLLGWDDVIAMYKREALIEIPFRNVVYGEDALWKFDALRAGKCVAHNTAARVYHHHLVDYDFTYKMAITLHSFRLANMGLIPEIPHLSLRKRLSLINTLFFRRGLSFNEAVKWWKYNLKIAKANKDATRKFLQKLKKGNPALIEWCAKYTKTPPVTSKD